MPVPEPASSKIVFIVDDDASVLTSLQRLIRSAGMEARGFPGAAALLAAIDNAHTGCIIIDVTMPKVTGFELQQQLTKQGITLPVIALSASDDEETRRRVRDLGARMFLRKPVDAQALLDAINWVTS